MTDRLSATLLSPGLHALNFDPVIFDDPKHFGQVLTDALGPLAAEQSDFKIEVILTGPTSAIFYSLDDDAQSTFSDPIIKVTTDLGAGAGKAAWLETGEIIIWIFDNSVIITEIATTIDTALLPGGTSPSRLERALAEFADEVFAGQATRIVDRILGQLRATEAKGGTRFLKSGPFSAERFGRTVWTNRTYMSDQEKDPALRALLRLDQIEDRGKSVPGGGHVYVGLNFARNKQCLAEFLRGLLTAQYLYMVLHSIFEEQRLVSRRSRTKSGAQSLTSLRATANRLHELADQVEIEFHRLKSTMQSIRLDTFQAAEICYNYSDLAKSVELRFNILDRDVARLFDMTTLVYSRVTRYVVIAISILQFISTSTDLYNIAKDYDIKTTGGNWGILWLPAHISFDLLTDVILAIVLLAAGYAAFRGERDEKRP